LPEQPRRSFSKEPHPPKWTGYQLLALIFGTLLSSQGTDASFVLTAVIAYWGFPPGFRSSFPTLPDRFPFRFGSGFSIRGRWGPLPFGVPPL
ncbi:hypothetical protein EF903_26195, partial [Streptomyces sp. WAC05292]|uniref:hypothetical protein n=1 Tax=Streptomyces sp. WAC05292 TaxID=2487418 RepID=UPI000FA2678C